MTKMHEKLNKHYGFGGIMEKIVTALQATGKNPDALTVDDLAPIDEFHTRGRESTLELAKLATLSSTDRVLDVGCGLGGTARHLAERYQCTVTGIDLTEEYISAGKRLTELVALNQYVDLRCGNALELPFEDGSFDVVWTEHAQMNIPDKAQFYSEISRVLKPAGRFLFHDIFRNSGESLSYPVPWAEDESISALATETQAQSFILDAGLQIKHWIGKAEESIQFFKEISKRIEANGAPPIGIHLLMGNNANLKLRNYVENLLEKRISVAMGMASRVEE